MGESLLEALQRECQEEIATDVIAGEIMHMADFFLNKNCNLNCVCSISLKFYFVARFLIYILLRTAVNLTNTRLQSNGSLFMNLLKLPCSPRS